MAITASTIGAAPTAAFTAGVYTDTYNLGAAGTVAIVALELLAGSLYSIDTDDANSTGDVYIRVFDRFGNEVKSEDDGLAEGEGLGGNLLDGYTEFLANYTGLYYVALSYASMAEYDPTTTSGRPGLVDNPPFLASGSLVVTDLGDPFFPDLNSAASITGTYDSGNETFVIGDEDRQIRVEYQVNTIVVTNDVEIARIDLVKGDRIVIDINSQVDPGNILDSFLRVFTLSGVVATQIAVDEGSGTATDSELIFFAPSTGDYYIGVSGNGNESYNAYDGTGTAAGDTGAFQVIIHRNPTLVGSNSAQTVNGGGRDDYIVLLAGADTSNAGDGFDTVAGGDDNDTLNGEKGEDVLYGEFGNDTLDGGQGTDILVGGQGADSLRGGKGSAADDLQGGAGNDTLDGEAGDDFLFGNEDNDTLIGGSGNDDMEGGLGADSLDGGADNDVMDGGAGNDTLAGGSGNDTLGGGTGDDSVEGGSGNDVLSGNEDSDTLLGGGGTDTLSGGIGLDTLTGGADADVFDFDAVSGASLDTITDFALGVDDIDLSTIFGAGVVNAGNLSQYVQTSTSGVSDSFLAVDANGATGGLTFTIIAQVNGVTQAQLFDVNNFIL